MMGGPVRIGITGHTDLTGDAAAVVRAVLVDLLREVPVPVVGVTCLASGADQLFARAVQETGGAYEVVLPAPDYRTKIDQGDLAEYDALLAAATDVTYSGVAVSGSAAYAEASRIMLERVDRLLAVWDGRPAARPGGTADVVEQARRAGIETTVVWPDGALRSSGFSPR